MFGFSFKQLAVIVALILAVSYARKQGWLGAALAG